MEKSAFKFISIFCLCLICIAGQAQVILDENGRPLVARYYTDVQGSPYLADNWQKGTVRLANGKAYNDVELKYDQVAEDVIFKGSAGQELRFAEPVGEFRIQTIESFGTPGILFRSGYKPTDGATVKTFYQVLSDGETPLLKRSFKKVMENKPYGSATTVKTFLDVNAYYLVKNGQPLKVKRDKKAIIAALGDYSAELENFISTNKLSLKSDSDLIMLFTFYNSLK
ncbi:hypothetical protein GZH53_17105 [Flavihumibacter sp. R14]|nr:hypothetical protein [Flavihumibacter soli]